VSVVAVVAVVPVVAVVSAAPDVANVFAVVTDSGAAEVLNECPVVTLVPVLDDGEQIPGHSNTPTPWNTPPVKNSKHQRHGTSSHPLV
jgi:hypothetical protein